MKIVLLGTTGYHPTDTRQTACMMLPELGIILDAGTAMYRARQQLATRSLDIFLTHTHLDHVIGLTFLFDIVHDKEVEQVRVHAVPDKINALKQHLFSEALFPIMPPITWCPLADAPVRLPQQTTITHFPLQHPGGSVGYRLDWPDRSLAYVTDTTASSDADYIDRVAGVDVLIHECYFPDGWEDKAELTGHSCLTPVVRLAQSAQVGRLVLVHINPLAEHDDELGLEAAQKIFPRTEIGVDRMEIDF
jgi:ribonuclease BN (tRNA processing enzyme)